MRKVLCINFPKSFQTELKISLENNNLKYYHAVYDDLTLRDNKIYFGKDLIESFDLIFVGLTSKRDIAILLLEYIKIKKIPNLIYGSRTENQTKYLEILSLNEANLPLIPSIVTKNDDDVNNFVANFPFPFITKPVNGFKGKDVLKHNTLESILHAISSSEVSLILQPFISNNGDYRILLLKHEVIGVIKRTPTSSVEFRSNISLGGIGSVANLPENILEMVIKSSKTMNTDMSGVDIIQDKINGNYYLMEVNTAPQFKGFMLTTGINVFEKIAILIKETIQ